MLIDAFKGLLGGKVKFVLSIIEFVVDESMRLSGKAAIGEAIYDASSQKQVFYSGISAYKHNFEIVRNGDTATQKLHNLERSFCSTRIAGMKLYDSLIEKAGHYTEEGQRLVGVWGTLELLIYKTPFN